MPHSWIFVSIRGKRQKDGDVGTYVTGKALKMPGVLQSADKLASEGSTTLAADSCRAGTSAVAAGRGNVSGGGATLIVKAAASALECEVGILGCWIHTA